MSKPNINPSGLWYGIPKINFYFYNTQTDPEDRKSVV